MIRVRELGDTGKPGDTGKGDTGKPGKPGDTEAGGCGYPLCGGRGCPVRKP